LIATWVPAGKSPIRLITKFAPSPSSGNYRFRWPTGKYLDGSGVLEVRAGSSSSAAVAVNVTLANGNTTDFKHSPNDWSSFLPPSSWGAARDPVVAAVGDGPSDQVRSNRLSDSIFATDPDLFLFLGDIYAQGTFTENRNHYGRNAMDGGPGSLWGRFAPITQPTIGNHEARNQVAWQDYFHGRPLYTSFRYANVLFFDLASSGASMAANTPQYYYVEKILTSNTKAPPPCVVSFWHMPARTNGTIDHERAAMWKLLTDNGGDLVLNAHLHSMVEYQPLNDALGTPSSGQATMVQLVNGAGGHELSPAPTGDALVAWAQGNTTGTIELTLNGAAMGGTPNHLSWRYQDKNGLTLHSGSRNCS